MKELKLNVVTRWYHFALVPINGGEPQKRVHIKAESEDAARLKLHEPELGWKWEMIEQER